MEPTVPITPVAAPALTLPVATPEGTRSFGAVLDARRGPAAQVASPAPPENAFRTSLAGLEQARQRLDSVLEAARSGRTFTPGELLGLQAQAYRYAQTVELAAKVVESGAQSVKQAMNTQV
jgi:hypothetical protein